jgi:ectoine hydroxylase-related dioxygenase (phytanoyl-CoA dioxygenase family)
VPAATHPITIRPVPGLLSGRRGVPDLEAQAPEGTFAQQRATFERDGYLVIDPGLDEATLDGAVRDLEGEFRPERFARLRRGPFGRPPLKRYSYRDATRIQDAWRTSRNVRAIALAPRVLGVLQALYDRRPLPFQTLNFHVGTQQPAHSDAVHFNSKPPGFMCGVWVALEDIDRDNGPLVYYPGSHRRPELTMEDVGAPPTPEGYRQYERYLAGLIDRERLEPRYGHLRKGQALVWAANLLHGGAKQNDRSRTRLSQVTHYFFEGCRYWTPRFSDRDRVAWRDPRWVR